MSPLFTKYGKSFGGVMQWASLGDQENTRWKPGGKWVQPTGQPGTFSNIINKVMKL